MNRNMLKNSLIGAGIGIGAALILLLVFCAVLTKCGDPARLVPAAAAVARFIGAAAAGFSAARFNRENGLVTGALSGGVYALLIPLASAFCRFCLSVSYARRFPRCAGSSAFPAKSPAEQSGVR